MLKKYPKGLLPVILVNMFVQFAFFILITNLFLFLEMKFGFTVEKAGNVYSIFYFFIFILTFIGGIIADKRRDYKGTIVKGLLLMVIGFFVLAIPALSNQSSVFFIRVYVALLLIAFGNGLFIGNLYAIIGQMYDVSDYSQMRDSGFLLSSLFSNIGILIAPLAITAIRNGWMLCNGFVYNSDFFSLCFSYIDNGESMVNFYSFQDLAAVSGQGTMVLSKFVTQYIHIFTTGFHFIFALAIVTIAISLIIFLLNEKKFPIPAKLEIQVPQMDAKLIWQRTYAFLVIFAVLNLFYFASNQDGFTLTYFARDYTELRYFGFNITKINALFTILLIPIILTIFGVLQAKEKEPSTLQKMAIGMGIATVAYLVMTFGSIGLSEPAVIREMGELPNEQRTSSFFLIVAFFILVIAKLFIYPLLPSFISQYARSKHQGVMQSVGILTTSIGNFLLFLSLTMYEHLPIWMTWVIFVFVCLLSMIILLWILKWVEKTLNTT